MSDAESTIRTIAKSHCIEFRTTAPYAFAGVTCCRKGYADIPVVSVTMYGLWAQDLVPIARSEAYKVLEACDLTSDCLDLSPTVAKSSRRRKVVDTNTSSRSFGKNKMLYEMSFSFEVIDRDAIPAIRNCLPRSFSGQRL